MAALAILGWNWTGRGLPGRIAALGRRDTRPRMILGWAAGTFATFGVSSLVALLLLGRLDALWRMPAPLAAFARRLGLPAAASAAELAWLAGTLLIGIALGAAVLAVQRRRGRRSIGLGWRSPAEARAPAERLPAALVALAAGVGEEMFFRLLLPLLVVLVTASAAAGFTLALAAFAALHRHQGAVGTAAVAFVGGWLTYLYLWTGALWLVALLHTLIDLNALVVRPWIERRPD